MLPQPSRRISVFVVLAFGLLACAPLVSAQIITSFQRTGAAVEPGWRFGEPGDQISLTGSGLGGDLFVGFATSLGGRTYVAAFGAADNQVNNVTIPGDADTGLLSIFKNGTETFSGLTFTRIGPEPYIVSLSTNVGSIGTTITVHGDNFVNGASQPVVTSMTFNGTAASSSPNGLTARTVTIPNGTTGPITASSPAGTGNSGTNFFYFTPAITNFIPSNAPPGTLVTIYGQNFLGASTVLFANGQSANFTVTSNTLLTATVPAAARTGRIFVIAPAGAGQSSNEFLVPPTIGGFTPTNGPVGTVVNIRGTNLFNVSAVTFNGVPATGLVTNNAGTNVTATVAPGTTTGFVVVTAPSGSVTSAVPFYLPPQFNNPAFAPEQGRAGTNVILSGVNLSNATAVTFGGISAVFSNLSPTTIGAVVPGAALTGPVVVTTPGGQATSAQSFRIQPLITGFNPTSGFPGDEVVITGTNFTANSVVTFNLSNAVVTAATLTSLTARVPTNATSGTIRVGTEGGVDESAGVFTVFATEIELAVALTNGMVVVSWPTSPAGFRLQAATNLALPVFWTNAGGVTSVFNGRFNVTNPATGSNGFFRLILP
jgi:hypothetical protein